MCRWLSYFFVAVDLIAIVPVVVCQDGGYIIAQPEQTSHLFQSNILRIRVEPEDATCGLKGIETLCDIDSPDVCFDCTDELPATRHPPDLMLDQHNRESPTFWQSTYWENYPSPFDVNITLSFRKVFQLEGDITIFFTDNHKPSQMTLEKSLDFGETWEVFQYYSTDCFRDFGLPSTIPFQISNSTDVICTDLSLFRFGNFIQFQVFPRFRLHAGEDGSFVIPVNRKFEEDKYFRDFFSFTDIRIHLKRPYKAENENLVNQQPVATNLYHYSISNIDFTSSCYCNLHGDFCSVDKSDRVVCNCWHQTGGFSCERCLPGFEGTPWQPGSFFPFPDGSANECTEHHISGDGMTSSQQPPMSASSDEPTKGSGQDTSRASSPGLFNKPVTGKWFIAYLPMITLFITKINCS